MAVSSVTHERVKADPRGPAGGWARITDSIGLRAHYYRNMVSLCGRSVLLTRLRFIEAEPGKPSTCKDCERLARQQSEDNTDGT